MYRTATQPLLKTPAKPRSKGRKTEAALAAALLVSFFKPWIYSLGTPLRIPEIRERLAGPHRLLSAFTSGSRVSADYRLSIWLYAIPIAAVLVLLLIGMNRYRGWMGALAGAGAVVAYFFLKGEVASFPFHKMAAGANLALGTGTGLVVMGIWR